MEKIKVKVEGNKIIADQDHNEIKKGDHIKTASNRIALIVLKIGYIMYEKKGKHLSRREREFINLIPLLSPCWSE